MIVNKAKCLNYISGFFVVLGYALFPMLLKEGTAFVGMGVIFWLLSGDAWRKKKFLLSDHVVQLALAIVLMALVSILYTAGSWDNNIERTLNRYWKILVLASLIGVMLNMHIRNYALYAFSAGVTFIVLSMYANIWMQLPWSVTQNIGFGLDHTVVGDYITQNLMVCFYAILCLDFSLKSRVRFKKMAWGLASLSAMGAIFVLSPGRTGYLLMTLSLMTYLFFLLKGRWRWIGLFAVMAVVVAAINFSNVAKSRIHQAAQEVILLDRQVEQGDIPDVTSIGARMYMWMNTWELIKQRPVAGWGLGSYSIKWCEQVPSENWCADIASAHPHNQYLMFWVELGAIGVLLYIGLMLAMAKVALKNSTNGPLLLGLITILAVDSAFNSPLWVSREYQFFLLMLPLIYMKAQGSQSEDMHDKN